MPHVVLETSSPLYELIEAFDPFVARDHDVVWRARDAYLSAGEDHALVECLIVIGERPPRRFFVHLAQRAKDASVVVRPYATPRVEPVPSTKRMIALVAEAIREAHPDVSIGHSTIRDAFSDRYRYEPDPEITGWDPLIDADALPRPADWRAVFGNDHPVEIEIGSGKGGFLVEAALAAPDTNFLSIEYARTYAEYLRDRVKRRGLDNVRVVHTDAGRFLDEITPAASLEVIHLYFPDPWPKKRHAKRRLVTPAFAQSAAAALVPGGELRFVTDHTKYFAAATEVFEADPDLEPAPVPDDQMRDLTNYERKYRAEGRPIHRAVYRARAKEEDR